MDAHARRALARRLFLGRAGLERAHLSDHALRGIGHNVVVHGEWAYVTKGAAGMGVVHLGRREPTRVVPVRGGESADDLAVADGLLFVLDARPPGHLAVYTLEQEKRLVRDLGRCNL